MCLSPAPGGVPMPEPAAAAASLAGGAAESVCLSPALGGVPMPKPPPTRHGPEPRQLLRQDFTERAVGPKAQTLRQRR